MVEEVKSEPLLCLKLVQNHWLTIAPDLQGSFRIGRTELQLDVLVQKEINYI